MTTLWVRIDVNIPILLMQKLIMTVKPCSHTAHNFICGNRTQKKSGFLNLQVLSSLCNTMPLQVDLKEGTSILDQSAKKQRSGEIKIAPGRRSSKTHHTLLTWKQIWLFSEHFLFCTLLIPSPNPKSWGEGYLRDDGNVVCWLQRKHTSFFSKSRSFQTKIISVTPGIFTVMFHFYTLNIFIYLQEDPFFFYDKHLLRIEILSIILSRYVYKNGIAQVGGFLMETLEALSASEVARSWFIWPPSPRGSGFLFPRVRWFQVD